MKFELGLMAAIILLALITFFPLLGASSSFRSVTGSDLNSSFLDLNDTPNSYSGQAGNFIQVNVTENGLQFTGSSPGDTNCDNNPLCVITGRINTSFDENVGDVNANTYRIKSNVGLRGDCGYFPFTINGVVGGLQFDCSDGASYILSGDDQFFVGLTGVSLNTLWTKPRNSNPLLTDLNHLGARIFMLRFPDGNQFMAEYRPGVAATCVGCWQSNNAPDFNFNKGRIRGDINAGGIFKFDQNVIPDANNTGSIGSQEKHVANIYGVNIFTGDLIFANGMYLHEFDENNTCLYSKARNQLTCFSENSMTSYRPIVQVNTGNKPVCDDSIEGMTWFTKGSLGVASKNEVCVQTALNNYLWITTI